MTSKYQEIYQRSIKDPQSFWSEVAESIFWYKKPSKILNSDKPPFYKWFQDGTTNTCYNAVDLHVNKGKGKKVAIIYSNLTKMGVELFSDQPGLQFYTGNMMEKEYSGKNSKTYGYQHAICLEPQHFPDAINHANFPSPILRKNKNYLSKIKIKLRNDF